MTFGWSADEKTSHAILDAAFDAGVNFIDTADVYSRWIKGNKGGESETIIGKWLKSQNRRNVIVATKVRSKMWEGPNGEGLNRHHIMHAVEDSLRRLNTDYIDLYQTHAIDPETPIEETLRALDDLVTSGKVRYIGASNYPAWRLTKSLWASDVNNIVRFESLQPHYSLIHRAEFENELAELCKDQNIGVIPYSPLAAGFLTGKYSRENKNADTTRRNGGLIQSLIDKDKAYDVLDVVQGIADTNNVPMAHVALAWLLSKETINSPIIGARTVNQLQEIIGATELTLSSDEIATLDKVTDE
jgi:aryl-alcohol dehydrogenase-like predicted oxidoreductase